MTYNSITVNIEASTIANEMARDSDLTYAILEELAYQLADEESNRNKFLDSLFKEIYENENNEILSLLEDLVKSFEHMKKNDD